MAEPKTSEVSRAYLAELWEALVGVPVDVRDGIVSGVQEELDGLSSSDAALRIMELGDPNFIAAEARAESAALPDVAQVANQSSLWWDVMAAALVMIGGFVLPVFGLLAGLTMLWISRTWTRAEKWFATLAPVALVVLVVVVGVALGSVGRSSAPIDSGGDVLNPLIPAYFDVVWSGSLVVLVAQLPIGIWLLKRAMRHRFKPVG